MQPEVSVVVPTLNRPAGLAVLMTALAEQTIGSERFEVIVVDDGSDPPQRVDAGKLDVQVVRHDRAGGPAAARNSGWRRARAPLVAFVDDDCAPAPGWLDALVESARDGDGPLFVIQGPVEPPPGEHDQVNRLTHTVEVGGPSRLFVSCNIAFSRPLLERTGGFDESFRRACGEDVELGVRALAAGAEMRWSGDALVHHEVRPVSLAGMLRQTTKWTDSVRTVAMHPELRDLLTARVFWKPTHPLLLLLAAGLLTRRPLIAAAAAAPYVRHYHRVHGGSGRALARWLPVHAAIDATEIGTAVAGSVQHRTLML